MHVALRMWLISDGLFFSNDVQHPLDDSTVGWILQRRRHHIQRCRLHPTLLPQLTSPFPVTGWFAQPTAVALQHRRHCVTKVSLRLVYFVLFACFIC